MLAAANFTSDELDELRELNSSMKSELEIFRLSHYEWVEKNQLKVVQKIKREYPFIADFLHRGEQTGLFFRQTLSRRRECVFTDTTDLDDLGSFNLDDDLGCGVLRTVGTRFDSNDDR